MITKLEKWLATSPWLSILASSAGTVLLIGFISIIAPNLGFEKSFLAWVSLSIAIWVFSGAMAISLKETIFLAYFNSGVRWQARLNKEGDHITIELSPYSPDHSPPSDGAEYYDVSFKISDS